MDSVLDSVLSASGSASANGRLTGRLTARLALTLAWLGWLDGGPARGRRRRMQLDFFRVAVATVAAVVVVVAGTLAWTWRSQQQAATASAALAVDMVDERLDEVAHELHRIAVQPALQGPLTGCPAGLVQVLLQESLNSSMVRRFEVLQEGQALRCGPQGERLTAALPMAPRTGLSLVLGGQIAAKPELIHTLDNGLAIKATLNPHALVLPATAWPDGFDAATLRVMAHSADAGKLLLWGPRQAPAQEALLLHAQAQSARHHLTLVAEVDTPTLLSLALSRAAMAAGLSGLLVLAGVAWVWRRAVLRARLVHRLAYALRKRQFEPFVQPIVDLSNGRCIGGEVLMRWKHPQRGILGPADFIEEAERTGLILGMSDLTMALAAHRLAPLAQAQPDLYFSFNITPGQLRENGFAQRLAEIFRPDTVPREQVLLELTERDFVDPQAKGRLIALRADGWRIAIDDFGTGQSSLSTIESLPIDRIKIDRAFVSAIDEKTVNRPVLDAIIQLARELHVPLIAEGVESRSQWDYLAARGVASAQGYLMARPMAITDYLLWLQEHAPEQVADPGDPVPSTQAQALAVKQRQLWRRMGAPGGLHIQDRIHNLRSYPACFVGQQAVDWMVATLGISRTKAVHQGQALVALGLLRHVVDEHDFKDGEFFYCLALQDSAAEVERLPEAAPGKVALQQALDFPWRSHSRGLLRHNHCATGRDVVDWIVKHHPTPRPTAQQWAAHWMRQGALRHVFDTQPFRDDRTLYRLG